MPIVTALAFNAEALDTLLSGLDAASHYGNGMNLYVYQGSNPVNRLDALGLSWGGDDIDDLIADLQGHRLYALGALNEGARIASLGMTIALKIAGGILGVDVFASMAEIRGGKGGLWAGLNIVMTFTPLGRVAKVIGKGFKWVRRASKGGRAALRSLDDLYGMTRMWRRGIDRAAEAAAKIKYPTLANKADHAHHIIPKYLGGKESGPRVMLNPAYHQLITNAFRTEWKYRQRGKAWAPPSVEQLAEICERVYSRYPLP